MPKNAILTLQLEDDLYEQFIREAEISRRFAPELLREFIKSFVAQQQECREHDLWFRSEVERSLVEADDPATPRLPHDQLAAEWRLERTELEKPAVELGDRGLYGCPAR